MSCPRGGEQDAIDEIDGGRRGETETHRESKRWRERERERVIRVKGDGE